MPELSFLPMFLAFAAMKVDEFKLSYEALNADLARSSPWTKRFWTCSYPALTFLIV